MNGQPQIGGSSQPRRSLERPQQQQNGHRMHERNAAPMPVGGARMAGAGGDTGFGPMGMAGMPRSPPKNKNTQLVPCKFFLHGTCQAGRTCPFSHDYEASARPAPCKYFSRGGCKFGRKCMLLHITPDGNLVNARPPQFPPGPLGPHFTGPLPPPGPYPQPPPPGLLSLQAQGFGERPPPADNPHEYENYQYNMRNGYDRSQIDMTVTSASPTYGSPPHDSRFGHSPPAKVTSVLDVPLPNSFDSNGISMAARNGPFAASVPSRFGVESPPASLPHQSNMGTAALRELHNSAFGGRGMDGVLAGSSPPSGPDEPLTFPKRPLHSDRLRAPRQQMISASLGTRLPTQSFEYSDDEYEDDNDTDREEDLLPASLRDLIPEGRSRKESRSYADDENSPASFLAAQRRTISGNGTPQEGRFGSPHSSSPSRLTSMLMRSHSGRADRDGVVGSPLRNASSYFTTSASRTAGDLSPTVSSPPRQASMSGLTKDLQRTKLDGTSQSGAVGMTRTLSNGSTGRSSLDRAVSSSGVGRERIDEEQDLFAMDEVVGPNRTAPRSTNGSGDPWGSNRTSFGSPPGTGEPTFGAIGGHRTAK